MRRCHIALVSLLVVSAAEAKPLPKGVTVSIQAGHPMVSVDGTTVPLTEDTLADWDSITAELSKDGKSIVSTGTRCDGKVTGAATKSTIPLTVVWARAQNKDGLDQLDSGAYDEAEGNFSAAVTLDGSNPEYATNLLKAQVLAGNLEAADRTLASEGKKAKAYFAWKLASDPALRPLAGRKSAAQFAVKPGKVRSVNLHVAIAYSPLGMVATRTSSGEGEEDAANPLEISVADFASGKEMFRMPIKTKAQVEASDALLQKLGFEYDSILNEVGAGRSNITTDGRAFVFSSKGHKLQNKGKTKPITIPDIEFVGWVPGALVIVAEHRNTVRCDDGTYRAALYTVKTP